MVARDFPYQRGFAAIGLWHPKTPENVGGVMRAAQCYGASMVAIAGDRSTSHVRHATNTVKAERRIPTLRGDDLHALIPLGAVPVAVDLVEGAEPLPSYQHPACAFYIFGPEDGTLGAKVLDWCRDRVMIPTVGCMNLAATVNVVLYDRVSKAMRAARKQENAA